MIRAQVPDCPWVFPGDAPVKPIIEIKRFWQDVPAETGLEDVRIHDLRHTFASLLVSPSDYRRFAFRRLGLWMPATTGTPGSERAAQGRPEPFLIAPRTASGESGDRQLGQRPHPW
jgi:hypothetical protein